MINDWLTEIKRAADSATKSNPEQFPEIFARLICSDLCKQMQQSRKAIPGEIIDTVDGYEAWMMAMATGEIVIKEYFQS